VDAVAQARLHLQKALDLDETIAEAHCTLGLIKSWYDWDWNGADREFQIALGLEPSNVTTLLWQSLLFTALARHQEAIASMRRAREIEPLSPSVNLYFGLAQAHAGQLDLAARQMQQSIELDPANYRAHMFLGKTLSGLERHEEALASLHKALSLFPDHIETLAFVGSALAGKGDREGALKMVERIRTAGNRTEPAVLIASVYARLGMADEMFDWLDRAAAVKSTPIYISVITFEFFPHFSDPRFNSFLASIGLPPRRRV
jgi:tetratricopeptide (TPR) repeat protein